VGQEGESTAMERWRSWIDRLYHYFVYYFCFLWL